MSILGLNDAIRSNRPPTERLVWATLESHANGARFWAMTHEELQSELHFSRSTIRDAIRALESDGIIRAERHKRRKTIFYMMRSYASPELSVEKQHPKSSGIDWDGPLSVEEQPLNQTPEPELSVEKQPSTVELSVEKCTPYKNSKNPTASSHAGAREGRADADASKSKPVMINVGGPGEAAIWKPLPPPRPATRSSVFGSLAQMGSPGPNGAETINGIDVAATTRRACELARIDPAQAMHDQCAPVRLWLNAGIEACDIYEIIRKTAERPSYNPPFSLGWFRERIMRRQVVPS